MCNCIHVGINRASVYGVGVIVFFSNSRSNESFWTEDLQYSLHHLCMSNKLVWEPYINVKKGPVFSELQQKKLAFISGNFHTQNSGKLPTFRAISAGPLSDSFHTQNSGKVILSLTDIHHGVPKALTRPEKVGTWKNTLFHIPMMYLLRYNMSTKSENSFSKVIP